MSRLLQFIAALILIFNIYPSFAAKSISDDGIKEREQIEMQKIKHDIQSAQEAIEILRRDEINYKLEKDILKEAYGSNLQSINIIITIVFGVFGILGYLGLRSIKDIRVDYTNELNNLKALKGGFEAELDELRSKQSKVETKVGDLTKTNEEQDRRLKTLEVIEKVAQLMSNKQWQWAINYIDVGLGLDPDNTLLLGAKSNAYGKLGEFDKAVKACSDLLKIEPNNVNITINMLEYIALNKQSDKFEEQYQKYLPQLKADKRVYLKDYLKVLSKAMIQDFDNAVVLLTSIAGQLEAEGNLNLGSWSFEDLNFTISKLDDGKQKKLLTLILQLFSGQLGKQQLINQLTTL